MEDEVTADEIEAARVEAAILAGEQIDGVEASQLVVIEGEESERVLDNLMIHSNAPWAGSGYGQQSAIFGPRIAALGYDVAFSAFWGLNGSRHVWPGPDGKMYPVYPGGADGHGNDVLGAHARHWFGSKGGIVLTLTDPWVMHPEVLAKLPTVMWSPIDHDPLIPRSAEVFSRANPIVVAMSLFGKRVLEEAGFKDIQYAPHGFDPNVFKPVDRKEARRSLGLPEDAFIVGMVAANNGVPSRKSFSQAIQAFAEFQRDHPDALLYLYTKLETDRGEDLPALCASLGVRARVVDQYALALGAPPTLVAAAHNAFDVLLNPSTGEGFGCTLMEAQACGTPCIVTDYSSMPEVADPEQGNWAVGGQKVWTPYLSWQLTPSVEHIIECLTVAYEEAEADRLDRRQRVWASVMQRYQADWVTATHWAPILEHAKDEFAWRQQLLWRPGK